MAREDSSKYPPSSSVFLGNINFRSTEADLHDFLSKLSIFPIGVKVLRDRDTNRSKGYAFADFNNEEEATAALKRLEGCTFDGRPLTASYSRPRQGLSRGITRP